MNSTSSTPTVQSNGQDRRFPQMISSLWFGNTEFHGNIRNDLPEFGFESILFTTNFNMPFEIPDLSVSKDDGVIAIDPGATTTYTIKIKNNGATAITNAVLTDTFSAAEINVTAASCTVTAGNKCTVDPLLSDLKGGGVNLPTLAAGEFYYLDVTATIVATSGFVFNFADVRQSGQVGSNGAFDKNTVKTADLKISKTDGSTTYLPGSAISYTIKVENLGPFDATGAKVTDVVPATITGVTATCAVTGTASCGTYGGPGNNVSFTGLNINKGAGNFLTITVNGTISPSATGDLVNTATVTQGTQTDPDLTNNTATDIDTAQLADLAVTKTDGRDIVYTGTVTTYTVRVTNIGPVSATGAIFKDLSALGLSKQSVSCSGVPNNKCNVAPTIGQLEGGGVALPTLASGEFYEILIPTLVTSFGGDVTNIATVAAPPDVVDPNLSNNAASDTDMIPVPPNAFIHVCKAIAANDPPPPVSMFTFTLKIGNVPVSSKSIAPGPTHCWDTEWSIDPAAPVDFTVVESIPANMAVQSIAVSPPGKQVGSADLTTGTVTIRVSANDDDTVTYTNQSTIGNGAIEICKQLAPGDPIPVGTQFTFTVTGTVNPGQSTFNLLAGANGSPICTAPILVTPGNQTITEAFRADTIVSAIDVDPATRLITRDLQNRSVVVNAPTGGVANQTVVTFTNQTTRSGYLEVCKDAQGLDVNGTFKFNVEGATANPYTVPVGACSLPIQVTIPQVGNAPFTAKVTELASPNYKLFDVTTSPTNALNLPIHFDQGFDANGNALADNTNGGYVVVSLTVGSPANQKIVRFVNQALPGTVKVCKITADTTNIPEGTRFTFTISGKQGPLPGTGATLTFDVFAGRADQGGFCAVAPGTWLVGEPLFIGENGISTANAKQLPLDGNATGQGPNTQAALRVSSITSTTSFLPAPVSGFNFGIPVNPDFMTPIAGYKAYAAITARRFETVTTFTNFVYRPAILKLCKTSSTIPAGTNFTFTIAPADPKTTWPYPTAPITVKVGSCTFVNGPFPQDPNFGEVNPFNYGTNIIVTENAVSGYSVNTIGSQTASPGSLTTDLPNGKGTLLLDQPMLPNFLFNELEFDNRTGSGSSLRRAISDFDGDGKSDIAVFRPSDGNWYWLSSQNSTFNAFHFGTSGDKIVPGDYDGDGKTDFAVWRPSDGTWYLQRSTAGFSATQFGLGTDLPAQGDFDGDGKTDIAVFRPSSGIWYMLKSTTGFAATQFGTSGDKPVTGDYDGDGKTDIAVFRPSDGNWYMLRSAAGFTAVQFGIPTDKVAPGDYDGDGKTDIAVYRDGNPGIWYLMKSTLGFTGIAFGVTGDLPVTGDFDGDGKADISVYRPSTGTWYLLRSTSGFTGSQFGAATDKPVPAGYVPIQ